MKGQALCLGGGFPSLALLPKSLGSVRCTPAERKQDSDLLSYPRRCLTRGEGTESWKLGEPPSPTLWRQICQSNCDTCTSGRGDMKFSPVTHRRVLGETSPSRSTLEVVGTGGCGSQRCQMPHQNSWQGRGSSAEEV